MAVVRIWQANIQKTIIAHVPVSNGQVQETGDFELDGVTFPAEIVLSSWTRPTTAKTAVRCSPPATWWTIWKSPAGTFKATMITAGIPTVFVNAADIGYTGTELREQINTDPEALSAL